MQPVQHLTEEESGKIWKIWQLTNGKSMLALKSLKLLNKVLTCSGNWLLEPLWDMLKSGHVTIRYTAILLMNDVCVKHHCQERLQRLFSVLSSSSRACSDIPRGHCGLFAESDPALETESWHHRGWHANGTDVGSSFIYRLLQLGNRSGQSLQHVRVCAW